MNLQETLYADGYYKGLAREPRFNRIAKILMKHGPCSKLLDIGNGDGDITLMLKQAARVDEVFGIDISAEAVAAAKLKGINSYQQNIDVDPFPFQDTYFDIIYCGEVIEHLFNPDHLLNEIHRLLKPDGICILTTPNLAGWPNRFALALGYQPYPTVASFENEGIGKFLFRGDEGQFGHIRVLTLRSLKELCHIHHLRIIGVKGCPVTINSDAPKPLLLAVTFVDRLMSKLPPLSTRIIAVLGRDESY